MKNFLPLLVVVVCGCAAAAEDPNAGYSGAGEAPGAGGANGVAAAGANASAGTSTALGGFGSGGANGSSGSNGVLGTGGATNTAGAFGAAGTGFGGASSGGAGFGGGAGRGGASFGGSAGRGGASFGGGAGRGGAGGSAGLGGAGGSGTITQVCTSKKNWTNGNGTDMRPGNDCRGCHSNFVIAGTVYPTLDEPNNCDGTGAGGVKVLITGADNVTLTLTPSMTSGNFYSTSAVKTPYSVKLTNSAGATRSMVAHQTAGNCNSCHTPTGGNGAPGRITAP